MKELFSNLEVARAVVDDLKRKSEWVLQVTNALPSNHATKPYDDRDVFPISYMMIDLDEIPEEQKEAHFKSEVGKILEIFETLDPQTQRPDPQKVSEFFKRMYGKYCSIVREDVDWNNKKQVADTVHSLLMAQTIYTMFVNFPAEYMQAFPDPEERRQIDMLALKRTVLGNRALLKLKESGIDPRAYNKLSLIVETPRAKHEIDEHVSEAVSEAFLENKSSIQLDPTVNPRLLEFFLNKPITGTYYSEIDEEDVPYDEETFHSDLEDVLDGVIVNTIFDKNMLTTTLGQKHTAFYLINGKSVKELLGDTKDVSAQELRRRTNTMLRDALTDGRSIVELATFNFDSEGKYSIAYKQIKVDLDALNRAELETHGTLRKAVHAMNISQIPKKFSDNEQRDEQQLETQESVKAARKDYEEKLIADLSEGRKGKEHRRLREQIPDFAAKKEEMQKKGRENLAKLLGEDDDSEIEFVANPDLSKQMVPPVFKAPVSNGALEQDEAPENIEEQEKQNADQQEEKTAPTMQEIKSKQEEFNQKYGLNFSVEEMLSARDRIQNLNRATGVEAELPTWDHLYLARLARLMEEYAMAKAKGTARLAEGLSLSNMVEDFEALLAPVREMQNGEFAKVNGGLNDTQMREMKETVLKNAPSRADFIFEDYKNGKTTLRSMRQLAASISPNSTREDLLELGASMLAVEQLHKSRSRSWRFFHPFRSRAEARDVEVMRNALLAHFKIPRSTFDGTGGSIEMLAPYAKVMQEATGPAAGVQEELVILEERGLAKQKNEWLGKVEKERQDDGVLSTEEIEKARASLATVKASERPDLMCKDARVMRELNRKIGLQTIKLGRPSVEDNHALITSQAQNIKIFASEVESSGISGYSTSAQMIFSIFFNPALEQAVKNGPESLKECILAAQETTSLILKAFTHIYEAGTAEEIKKMAFGGMSARQMIDLIKKNHPGITAEKDEIKTATYLRDYELSKNPEKLDAKTLSEQRAALREQLKLNYAEIDKKYDEQISSVVNEIYAAYDPEADRKNTLDYYPTVEEKKEEAVREPISVNIESKNEQVSPPQVGEGGAAVSRMQK